MGAEPDAELRLIEDAQAEIANQRRQFVERPLLQSINSQVPPCAIWISGEAAQVGATKEPAAGGVPIGLLKHIGGPKESSASRRQCRRLHISRTLPASVR